MAHILVERALALVPDIEDFLPLTDAVIGTSKADPDKTWARSSAYATVGKRVVDPARLAEMIPRITERVQQRLQQLFSLVFTAIQQQEAGEYAAAAETLIRAGEMEEGEQRLDKAERIYMMALEIARDLRDKRPQVLALRRLGRVTRTARRLDESWSWYQQSYHLSIDEMDLPGQIIACQGLGNLCDDRGQREDARRWYEEGLHLAQEIEDPQLEWPFYSNLSGLATRRGDLAEAGRLLDRARTCIEAAGDEGSIFYWYNNRGLLLLESDEPELAEKTLREGLERGGSPFWEMVIRLNIGESLLRQDRLFEAEEEARKAEELSILHRLIPYLVDVYSLFGRIATGRCDEEGFVFFEQALEVCRERGLPEVKEAPVYHEYGLLYRGCGRPVEAAAYLDRAREIYARLGLNVELERVRRDMELLEAPAPAPTAA